MVKKAIILLTLLSIIFFTVSCSKQENYFGINEDEKSEQISDFVSGNITERKIIITASYRIETRNLKETVSSFTKQVSDLGGYIQESNISLTTAEFTFRIPSDKLEVFFNFTEQAGNVTFSSQKGKDVTVEYHDTQSELKALKIHEERLLALLESATSLDNILTLEKQLNEVRTSIEKINTRLNELNSLIDYATVDIELEIVEDYSKKDNSFVGLISRSFKSSINFGANVLKYIAVIIVWLAPYLLVTAAIIFIIIFVSKKKKNKFNKKNL